MMDFLADNYIWFFVVAVVLLFALIGFIVGSKRKQKKNEFKGESVSENVGSVDVQNDVVINDIPTSVSSTPVASAEPMATSVQSPVLEEVKMESVNEIGQVNAPVNNELGNMPIHEFNTTETGNTIIGEPITSTPSEPVVPTAPESFYDEPLMPEQKVDTNMSFEINTDENNK